jgi:hypothetical protein
VVLVDVRKVGRGVVHASEADAVRWLVSHGLWSAAAASGRIHVKRRSARAYDLLVWPNRLEPGAAWADERGHGDSLVEACLLQFRKQGRVSGWPARQAYSTFVKVVAGEQRRSRMPARKRSATIGSPAGRYIGKGWLQDEDATWSQTVRRVVFRKDGCVLEGEGHIGDGSHYDFQANLLLASGHYWGSVHCVLRESRYEWESEVDLSVSYANGRELELDGEWIEAADATTNLTCSFSLELLRDDA